mmetsp:Transcript_2417/g.4978  ORF Transcript_2417/g.4978 Transcript_2417/m.4978 type:complete len:205 (+) Transcript_2417:561-1175(+)
MVGARAVLDASNDVLDVAEAVGLSKSEHNLAVHLQRQLPQVLVAPGLPLERRVGQLLSKQLLGGASEDVLGAASRRARRRDAQRVATVRERRERRRGVARRARVREERLLALLEEGEDLSGGDDAVDVAPAVRVGKVVARGLKLLVVARHQRGVVDILALDSDGGRVSRLDQRASDLLRRLDATQVRQHRVLRLLGVADPAGAR